MDPYRSEDNQYTTQRLPNLVSRAPVENTRRATRRLATTALLVAALVTGGVGGGTVGAVAATQWLVPQHTALATNEDAATEASAPVNEGGSAGTGQSVSTATAPTANIAGEVYSAVSPAVVNIQALGQAMGGAQAYGTGSGFVVDARGLIVTNYHVVADARSVSVRFNDGQQREGQVLGYDRGNDVALLKVDLPENIPVAMLGDSDQTEVGETAIAIGSPFGLDGSVTQGIISAVKRDWAPANGRVRRNLLQTDAPINPGNSGGPLLNARGEVIGINTMIESPVRGSVGVGFAIPINLVKRLVTQLESGAKLEPVWLGIAGQPLDPTIAQDQGLAVDEGILITSVVPGGPADQAGLRGGEGLNERIPRGGDVIVAVDDTRISDLTQLTDILIGRDPGDQITLTILRDGQEQQIEVTLQAWPNEAG